MLAANFLSAEKLGLTDKERDALVGVLGMLERDELPHAKRDYERFAHRFYLTGGHERSFNMGLWKSEPREAECGTVCCIAGWADEVYKTDFVKQHYNFVISTLLKKKLNDLFCGPIWVRLGDIQPHQAAAALRSYLTTGEADWEIWVK